MANPFSQIYIQIIFAVKGRQNLLQKPWREDVFKYMANVIKNNRQKPIIVNGVSDHVHLFIGIKPTVCISDLVRDIKSSTTAFINGNRFVPGRFSWQEGFSAFSYSHSQVEQVYTYVLNQEKHHAKISFRDEYLDFLKKFDVEYNPEYLLEWIE